MRPLVVASATRSPCRVNARRLHLRNLSSQASRSSSSSDQDELLTGWDARFDWLERTLRHTPRLMGYADKRVFAPSLSPAHHALMFVALNAPQRLDLDVPQFLQGAAVATKRVLEDTSDDAFVKIARTAEHSPVLGVTVTPSSPSVRRMREYCLPHCFEQLQTLVQRQLAQGSHPHTMDVCVESVYLTRVQYACMSARQHNLHFLQDELRYHHTNADDHTHDGDDRLAVERLQLQVEVRTLEWLKRTRHSETSTSVTELQQRNVYVARFTSVVTDPDELDWRLASIAVRTRGKPVEVSSTCVTHRPAIQ